MTPEFQPPNCSAEERSSLEPDRPGDAWYSREYLPHYDDALRSQSVTFRLFDSLPGHVYEDIKRTTRDCEGTEQRTERHRRIERFLDRGHGKAWLDQPGNAEIVENSLLYHDEEKYCLHAWVIMPNHVHVLFTPRNKTALSEILHAWKSYSANAINDRLGRSGTVWQREYYDRYVRNDDHFWTLMRYIEQNPVKANLCSNPGEWKWSSAYDRQERGIQIMDYDQK